MLAGKKLCLVPVLRAGLGMVDAMLSFAPSARVGHIGLYRDPETLEAIEYYFNMPRSLPERTVIVVDPMLATGHSAVAALGRLKQAGAKTLKLVCLLAAPTGIDLVQREHPDVPIYVVAIDERLDDHAYIVPGLGDAGDRLFGTKKPAKSGKSQSAASGAHDEAKRSARAPLPARAGRGIMHTDYAASFTRLAVEGQPVLAGRDRHRVAVLDLAGQDQFGQMDPAAPSGSRA